MAIRDKYDARRDNVIRSINTLVRTLGTVNEQLIPDNIKYAVEELKRHYPHGVSVYRSEGFGYMMVGRKAGEPK